MEDSTIVDINNSCPHDQGVFLQPAAIPSHIKEPVVYCRWLTGGRSGGNYHEGCEMYDLEAQDEPFFAALFIAITRIIPHGTLSIDMFRDIIDKLEQRSDETDDWDYYRNYTNHDVKFVILSQLEKYLEDDKRRKTKRG